MSIIGHGTGREVKEQRHHAIVILCQLILSDVRFRRNRRALWRSRVWIVWTERRPRDGGIPLLVKGEPAHLFAPLRWAGVDTALWPDPPSKSSMDGPPKS